MVTAFLTVTRQKIQTKEKVALKILDLEGVESELDDIEAEIRFLSECKSPHCVEYYGSFLKGHQLFIVMEYLSSGSIAEQVKSE